MIGLVTDVERVAGLHRGRAVEIDLQPAFFDVRGKGDNAIAQRTDEDFLRIKSADERDVDVAAAFEGFGQPNVLNAARGVRLKPGISVNFLALDGDQPAAAVGGDDADSNVVARIVLFTIEFDLELGVLFQRSRRLALAND